MNWDFQIQTYDLFLMKICSSGGRSQ